MNFFTNLFSRYCLLTLKYKRQFFIIGDGRSGTTWVADVLNFDKKYLNFFEPFHGRRILKLPNDRLYPIESDFSKINCENFKFNNYAKRMPHYAGLSKPNKRILSGSILKDISSHLVFPIIQEKKRRNVLIIRNPISVAISKEKYGQWHSKDDIKNLLSKSPEFQKIGEVCFLEQLLSTKFLEYTFVWCLLHRIILSTLDKIGTKIVFYENLLRNPEQSFEDLFHYLGDMKRFNKNKKTILDSIKKLSKTTIHNNTINNNLVNDQPWDGEKSEQEMSQAYDILKIFDLYDVYKGTITPKVSETGLMKMAIRWL